MALLEESGNGRPSDNPRPSCHQYLHSRFSSRQRSVAFEGAPDPLKGSLGASLRLASEQLEGSVFLRLNELKSVTGRASASSIRRHEVRIGNGEGEVAVQSRVVGRVSRIDGMRRYQRALHRWSSRPLEAG